MSALGCSRCAQVAPPRLSLSLSLSRALSLLRSCRGASPTTADDPSPVRRSMSVSGAQRRASPLGLAIGLTKHAEGRRKGDAEVTGVAFGFPGIVQCQKRNCVSSSGASLCVPVPFGGDRKGATPHAHAPLRCALICILCNGDASRQAHDRTGLCINTGSRRWSSANSPRAPHLPSSWRRLRAGLESPNEIDWCGCRHCIHNHRPRP